MRKTIQDQGWTDKGLACLNDGLFRLGDFGMAPAS